MEKVEKKMRIGFLGRGELGMKVLSGLIASSGIDIPIIISCGSSPEVKYSESDFEQVANAHNIPFYKTNLINSETYVQILKDFNLDLVVAMLWLYTIEDRTINTARLGFVNCHGGLLPQYRGNACANWSILNEEKIMGITAHFMKGGDLDSGPIIKQTEIKLTDHSTIAEIVSVFDDMGSKLVLEAVELIRSGNCVPVAQQEELASFCYPRLPRDGEIDWAQSAWEIDKLVRAAGKPYPGAYSYFQDVKDNGKIKKMAVYSGHVEAHPLKFFYAIPGHLIRLDRGNKWAVVCGDKKLFVLSDIAVDAISVAPNQFFKTVRQRMGIDRNALLFELWNKVNALEGK
jgi:methionyl-tRNA formyltransferase